MSILDAMGIGNIQRTFTSFQKSITDVRLAPSAQAGPQMGLGTNVSPGCAMFSRFSRGDDSNDIPLRGYLMERRTICHHQSESDIAYLDSGTLQSAHSAR